MAARRGRATTRRGRGRSQPPLDAAFDFVHEDGATETITETIELGGLGSEGLPSLLGWDVLRHFRLDLNASRGSVALLPP